LRRHSIEEAQYWEDTITEKTQYLENAIIEKT
jgi:hypothetical protein